MEVDSGDSSPTITIGVDNLLAVSDFLTVCKAILKFVISQKYQIPSAYNYDALKKYIDQDEIHSTDITKKEDHASELCGSDANNIAPRLRKRINRVKVRNKLKIKQYVEKMEEVFQNLDEVFSDESGHLELHILLGAAMPTVKYVLIIKVPQFSTVPDESFPVKKLLPRVLSGLLSDLASSFFAKKAPLTYLHVCLKTSHQMPLTQLQGTVGNSRSHRLQIEFVSNTPINNVPKGLVEDIDKVTEDFEKLFTPEAVDQIRKTSKKKPVRRLTFSTPRPFGGFPDLERPKYRLSGIGNISGISSLECWNEVEQVPSELVENGNALTYYYRIGGPVKGLRLLANGL